MQYSIAKNPAYGYRQATDIATLFNADEFAFAVEAYLRLIFARSGAGASKVQPHDSFGVYKQFTRKILSLHGLPNDMMSDRVRAAPAHDGHPARFDTALIVDCTERAKQTGVDGEYYSHTAKLSTYFNGQATVSSKFVSSFRCLQGFNDFALTPMRVSITWPMLMNSLLLRLNPSH